MVTRDFGHSVPSSLERSMANFLDSLASAEPTPGGGSASALAGALGAALVSMVCRLTLGRDKFAEVEVEMQQTLEQAEVLGQRLAQAVDDDARAYEAVITAIRMPRGTDAEREARKEATQAALREATRVPLAVARDCARLSELARFVASNGNPSASSDGSVATLLAAAGLRGALYNVQINLAGIQATDFSSSVHLEVKEILAAADQWTREL